MLFKTLLKISLVTKWFLKYNLILPPSYSFKASAKASMDSISKLFVGSSYNIYKQEENYNFTYII